MPFVPNKEDVHNKTYCRDWIVKSGNNSGHVDAQSDLTTKTTNISLSSNMSDLTSVSHKEPEQVKVSKENYFYSKKSATDKRFLPKCLTKIQEKVISKY